MADIVWDWSRCIECNLYLEALEICIASYIEHRKAFYWSVNDFKFLIIVTP